MKIFFTVSVVVFLTFSCTSEAKLKHACRSDNDCPPDYPYCSDQKECVKNASFSESEDDSVSEDFDEEKHEEEIDIDKHQEVDSIYDETQSDIDNTPGCNEGEERVESCGMDGTVNQRCIDNEWRDIADCIDINGGLVAYYSFDNEQNLGEELVSGVSHCFLSDGVYHENRAAFFSGTSESMSCGDIGIGKNGTATLSGWFYFNEFASETGKNIGLHSLVYQYTENDNLFLRNTNEFFIVPDLKIGKWHNILLTYSGDSSTAKLYLDGVLTESGEAGGVSDIDALNDFFIGDGVLNNPGQKVDELKIWNRVLNQAEIETVSKGNPQTCDSDENCGTWQGCSEDGVCVDYTCEEQCWLSPAVAYNAEYETFDNIGEEVIRASHTNLIWTKNSWSLQTFDEVSAHCSELEYGGDDDWRVPEIDELKTLISPENVSLSEFPGIEDSYFWSGSSFENLGEKAWAVDFSTGSVKSEEKTESYYLKCVRKIEKERTSGIKRFRHEAIGSDLIVKDMKTRLIWTRTAGTNKNWTEAVTLCSTYEYAGQSGWRLPSNFELDSILDYSKYNPATASIDDFQRGYFWSLTKDDSGSDVRWLYNFSSGSIQPSDKDNRSSGEVEFNVICVK